jgi:hypothetical protein
MVKKDAKLFDKKTTAGFLTVPAVVCDSFLSGEEFQVFYIKI